MENNSKGQTELGDPEVDKLDFTETNHESNSIFQSIKNIVTVLDKSEKKAQELKNDPGFQLVEENDNEGSDDFEDLLDAAGDIDTIEVFNEESPVETNQDDDLDLRPDVVEIMQKFEDPTNVKKSFEVKVENDDDDEIFIVHEEGDDMPQDQDSLFVSAPSITDSKKEQD